jgi:peptide/nickel transport system substrate-binding protein
MNRRDRGLLAVALVIMAAIGLALVVTAPPPGADGTPAPSATTPTDLLREGVVGKITTFDPLFASDPAEQDGDALLFRGLTRLGAGGTVEADLAASWATSADGRTWTFQLRDDVRWDDGQPLTADDVTFTILTLQHPDYDGPLGRPWRDVIVQRLGRYEVQFQLGTALASFLTATTQPIVPAHMLAAIPVGKRRTATFGTQPVGNGPFRLAALETGVAHFVRVGPPPGGGPLVLPSDPLATLPPRTAAPTLPGLPRPELGAIDLFTYATASEAAAAFRAGDLDTLGGLPASLTAGLAQLPGVRRIVYPTTVLTAVVFNLRDAASPFRDARARRALLAAIDRHDIVTAVLGGAGSVSDIPIPPSSPYRDPATAVPSAHDLTAAATLLSGAGWKKSGSTWTPSGGGTAVLEVVTLDADTNPTLSAVATHVVADWAVLGVAARITGLSASELVEGRLLPHEFDVAIIDINLGDDPDLFPLLASSQAALGGVNLAGYQSTELDDLLTQARRPADAAARRASFTKLGTFLAKELPFLTLHFAERVELVRDVLQGPAPREIGGGSDRFWDVLTWRLAGTAAP